MRKILIFYELFDAFVVKYMKLMALQLNNLILWFEVHQAYAALGGALLKQNVSEGKVLDSPQDTLVSQVCCRITIPLVPSLLKPQRTHRYHK